ncbi:MAG: hypothetical protein NC253_05290 [Ruminococcus sp.]|nr:hypothetical protein [Ruminococcus sp.]MCM1380331.1 hypothetical protein [Muribaculaceae bacterium]MCM1478243.1 hypothetical protein [Muribaculaceae bacterium]
MIDEICTELKNWFTQSGDKHFGAFTISDGHIAPSDFLQQGQYYRVVGSVFNDGVHRYGDENDVLTPETFNGAVWAMRVPYAVVQLAAEIELWTEKYGDRSTNPYTSESFAGYSYSKATGSSGGSVTWQDAFRARLNKWRKI